MTCRRARSFSQRCCCSSAPRADSCCWSSPSGDGMRAGMNRRRCRHSARSAVSCRSIRCAASVRLIVARPPLLLLCCWCDVAATSPCGWYERACATMGGSASERARESREALGSTGSHDSPRAEHCEDECVQRQRYGEHAAGSKHAVDFHTLAHSQWLSTSLHKRVHRISLCRAIGLGSKFRSRHAGRAVSQYGSLDGRGCTRRALISLRPPSVQPLTLQHAWL
jgi:hypothetical protein